MAERLIAANTFDPRKTQNIIVHDGRFHADDVMFTALAMVAGEKFKNRITVKRVSVLPNEYDEFTVAGDVGLGVYDHHVGIDNTESIGMKKNDEQRQVSACGLLYEEIHDIILPGVSETKRLFEALIDIIEHCDNTADNNTFSDSINMLSAVEEDKMDEMFVVAVNYVKAIINGFVSYHTKEVGGKSWSIPRICNGVVPGVADKKSQRYWNATNQLKNKYKYVSYNGEKEIKLKSIDTYSLACGALTDNQRKSWRIRIEENDAIQIAEMERREREEWPKAVAAMENRTIYLDQYLPYGQYVKDLNALFLVMPSQRGGYTITIFKTNTGKYRFNPDLLMRFDGCSFVANDKRFVYFDTKEQAMYAATTAGKTIDKFLELNGISGYREIFAGCSREHDGDFYQEMISEDIALNMFVKENVKNLNNLTVDEYRMLQIAIMDNPYLIHCFCVRFNNDDVMSWDTNIAVIDPQKTTKENLWTKNRRGSLWNMGLQNYLTTPAGVAMFKKVHPNK